MDSSYRSLVSLVNAGLVFIDMIVENFVERGGLDAIEKFLELPLISRRWTARNPSVCSCRAKGSSEEGEGEESEEALSKGRHLVVPLSWCLQALFLVERWCREVSTVQELLLDVSDLFVISGVHLAIQKGSRFRY